MNSSVNQRKWPILFIFGPTQFHFVSFCVGHWGFNKISPILVGMQRTSFYLRVSCQQTFSNKQVLEQPGTLVPVRFLSLGSSLPRHERQLRWWRHNRPGASAGTGRSVPSQWRHWRQRRRHLSAAPFVNFYFYFINDKDPVSFWFEEEQYIILSSYLDKNCQSIWLVTFATGRLYNKNTKNWTQK